MSRGILVAFVAITSASTSSSNYLYDPHTVSLIKNHLTKQNGKAIRLYDDIGSDRQNNGSISVTYKNVEITPSRWSWTEIFELTFSGKNQSAEYYRDLNISFDPRDIKAPSRALTTKHHGWDLILECHYKPCISVTGEGFDPKLDTRSRLLIKESVKVNDVLVGHGWIFRDANTAEQVELAVKSLLQTHGTKGPDQRQEVYATTIEAIGDAPSPR